MKRNAMKRNAMKRNTMNYVLMSLGVLGMLFSASALAQTTAEEIVDTVLDSQRGGETSYIQITMQVLRPDKDTKVFGIESWGDGEERSHIRVLQPAREKGQAFLQDGESFYLYNPRLRRTLRLPPSGQGDAFLGSDISYNDLAGRDLEEDYTPEITAEDEQQVTVTLTPSPLAPTPYGKVVLIADKVNNYRPLSYEYFDQRDTAVRSIEFSNYTYVDSAEIYFPTHIEVINLLDEGEKTVVDFSELQFGVDVNQQCFTQQALERGC